MKLYLILFTVFLCTVPLIAQEHQHGDHHPKSDVGDVNFPVTCDLKIQADFNRAVGLLHNFWYAEAEKEFEKIAAADPKCSMAQWGIAMSNYHPIWAPPNPTEMQKGKAAADKASSMDTKSGREQLYVSAISAFYKDAETVPHKTRAQSYASAMQKVHQQNPDDLEAAIFYALSLLGTADVSDKTYAVQKQAAAILNPLVEKAPNHPGIAHYIIHSFDYPALAELALPAARSYAKIAPASPHAAHMPSHIFIRLGLWDESIQSNIDSAEKAKKHVQKTIPDAGSFDELHAMDYLVYAYLQLDQEEKARQVAAEAAQMKKLDLNNFAAAYAFGAIPARIAIERHLWKEAASLQVKPEWFPWEKFPFAEAIVHYAVGIGNAHIGDLAKAQKAADRLSELRKILEPQDPYWTKQVDIQQKTVVAWIAFAEGKKDQGIQLMQQVAELEDSTEKHPVTPGVIMPAHEMVAEMLLEAGKTDLANAEFEKSLKTAPNRRHPEIHQTVAATNR
jgi:tetratricopeptide (TPR) repeat protein